MPSTTTPETQPSETRTRTETQPNVEKESPEAKYKRIEKELEDTKNDIKENTAYITELKKEAKENLSKEEAYKKAHAKLVEERKSLKKYKEEKEIIIDAAINNNPGKINAVIKSFDDKVKKKITQVEALKQDKQNYRNDTYEPNKSKYDDAKKEYDEILNYKENKEKQIKELQGIQKKIESLYDENENECMYYFFKNKFAEEKLLKQEIYSEKQYSKNIKEKWETLDETKQVWKQSIKDLQSKEEAVTKAQEKLTKLQADRETSILNKLKDLK